MKKSSLLAIVSALLLTACGTASQYAGSGGSSRFQDSFYGSAPSFMSRESREESRKETDALVERTRASKIYLFGEKKDTVMIPENMSARIQYDKGLGSTVVTVGENPYDWQNNINPWAYSYYTPYSVGSSWYWSRHYDPWYWNTWAYAPPFYSGWYDPFYMGGWYDPWYYGYNGWYGGWNSGWYSPWYGPYYCGWYGGWDPYWDYHYHHHYPPHHHGPSHIDRDRGAGSRREATGTRIHGGTSSRRGTALASRADRVLNATSGSVASSSSSSSRPVRVATSSRKPAEISKVSASRPATVRQPSATTVQNYRRPGVKFDSSSSVSTGSPAVRQPSSVSRPSGTIYRSESSSGSSDYRSSRNSGSRSSFSSGSSSSRSSSFSSGGSSSRSSGGSRSGGYSGSRR